jgi:hypothetical protein
VNVKKVLLSSKQNKFSAIKKNTSYGQQKVEKDLLYEAQKCVVFEQ